MLRVLNQAFDQTLEAEERAADPLAGGLMRGDQCGMVWGAALACGVQSYRRFGKGPQAEAAALLAAQRIVEAFETRNKRINCREVTGIDPTAPSPWTIGRFLLKSSFTGSCFGMAARYAPAALEAMEAAFAEEAPVPLPALVSCSAVLAGKLGASDLHTVMAAGLAGGIGLSGNACGALGTAIWLRRMHSLKDSDSAGLRFPEVEAILERFKTTTNNTFECAQIVGRKFENLHAHADYLSRGGCAGLLESLAEV